MSEMIKKLEEKLSRLRSLKLATLLDMPNEPIPTLIERYDLLTKLELIVEHEYKVERNALKKPKNKPTVDPAPMLIINDYGS